MSVTPAAKDLLRTAITALDDAYRVDTAAERYVAAHVAALRAGAALLANSAKPSRSHRIRSVWQVLPGIAPELEDWCTYFDAIGKRRVFVEIGAEPVSPEQADDLVRDAERFMDRVAAILEVSLPIPSFAG